MQSPPVSPSYDYPSRAYPYPHVDTSKDDTTSSYFPRAPPPTASTASATRGEYFFPFPNDSPQAEGTTEHMSTPRTRHSFTGPAGTPGQQEPPVSAGFPIVPRRSSFNYVHDLAEFQRRGSLKAGSGSKPAETEEGSKESNTTPPASPSKHRPHRLSLRDYLPLGRLPLRADSDSEVAIDDEDTANHKPNSNHEHQQQPGTFTPPESPVHRHHTPIHYHHRHNTVTAPVLMSSSNNTTGTATHNCFSSEDMKHIQHVNMLVEEAVEAFVLGGEERRRRRDSFGREGKGFTTTPSGVAMGT